MANNSKSFLLKITKEASQTLPLPSFACFLLEFLSQSQIFSLILTQLLTKSSIQTTSHLSQTLNQLLSYLEPLHIFDPFTSESMALTMFCLSIVYILVLLGLLFTTSLLIEKGKYIKIALSKVLSFLYLLHSRVLFFPIHCFMARALKLNKNCLDTESLYCNKGWLFGVILLLVLNIVLAIIKEGFCYTVHRDRSHYSMKGNQLPLTILFHKIIVVFLFYLIDNSTDAVILCNIGFCILTLVILQIGLPFYSLMTLKISVICSTLCTISALVSFARVPGYKKDLILFTLCLLPIGIKISLIFLKGTLSTVFQQKAKRPYQAIHLPVLIEDYQSKMSLFPFPQKMNSKTLFSLAFIRGNVPEGYNLKDEQEYNQIEAETYKAAISYLSQLSKQYPNDQLLLISMMEIYVDILKDTMKAIYTINRVRTHPKLSLAGQLSLEIVSGKFEGNQFSIEDSSTAGKKTIQLDFFVVKAKTAKLKELIQKEVSGHLLLWRQIEGKKVDVMNIIHKANEISSQGKEVAKYWNENFSNSEGIYVSASVIYGLYIQIVQALPFEGLKLARKAYKAIKNRFHTHKEVMDIITGKSAIIAASIEPDKLGKIVDASSSVKKMFRTGKHGLIGTNLNGILPVAVAARHNGFIRNYLYRNSRDELNTQIVNYARTSDGEYFKVKVSLLISPFTQNGLNIVAHIKRLSDNEPIMIIDQEGKIIEYSESLGNFLNINVKREVTKIDALYPELERVNHAFNIFYKAEQEELAATSPQRNPLNSASISFEDDFQLDAVKITSSQINSPAPQSTRRLLSQGTTTERSITKSEAKPAASSKTGQWKVLARMVTLAQMGKAEAEEICGKFKDGHEVTYLGSKKPNETPVGGLIKNKIEIEPLIIDGLIFKVLKFKHNVPFLIDNNPNNKSTTCGVQKGTTLGLFDEFADKFPIDEERNSLKGQHEASIKISNRAKPKYEAFDTDSVLRSPELYPQRSHFGLLEANKPVSVKSHWMQSKASMDHSNSDIDSQMSSRINAKRINNTLQVERPNRATSLSIRMVYLAVVVIITSICIDLIFTKKSLQNMEQAMNLVSTVNLRFSKSLIAWQSAGVLYTRITGFRPFDMVKILKYQGLTTNASLVMLDNAIELSEEIQDFDDDRVTSIFYGRTIDLYDPTDGSLFNGRKSDSFTASTILTTYNLYIGKYESANIKDLNGSKEMLFVLNNTANDFMESLENAITDVSDYFQSTRTSNISLLKVIMSLELLFVITPVILVGGLIMIILKLYMKLFLAVTNLLPQSTLWRISQLEKIQAHLEEDIEDSLIDFENFKLKEYTKILIPNQNVTVGTRSKEFSMKALRLYTLRYLLVSFTLVIIIVILFSIALSNSIENMDSLNKINKKARVAYQSGSDVKMVIPSFYLAALFANDTTYKIKNSVPISQVKIYYDALGNANNELISNLYSDSEDLEDATVRDILDGDVCNYVQTQFQTDCRNYTNNGAFGLLGLQPKFYQICGVIGTYMAMTNPTRTQASNAVGSFSTTLINLHFVIYDAYDSLSAYFVNQFNALVDKKINPFNVGLISGTPCSEKIKESYNIFALNMTTMLVAMILIRIVVLKRLQDLQITVRRIVRIIPYKIIEENKIMSYYLASEFGQELREMRELQS